MIKIITIVIVIAVGVGFNINIANAQGDYNAGKQKSTACAACHGVDGNNQNPAYPKLAGQNQRYLIMQLLDYKQGKASGRYNPIMTSLAMNLSDQDIKDLAVFYAKQKPTYEAAEPKYVQLGRQLYKGGNLERGITACSACHGPKGQGNPEAGIPRLGGQHADYIVAQLKAYQDGQRKNDLNKMMRLTSIKLRANEIAAVASYISGLH